MEMPKKSELENQKTVELLQLPTEEDRQEASRLSSAVDAIYSDIYQYADQLSVEDLGSVRSLMVEVERLSFSIKDLVDDFIYENNLSFPESEITESLIKANSLLEDLQATADKIHQEVERMGYVEVKEPDDIESTVEENPNDSNYTNDVSKDIEFFRRWQNGDPSIFIKNEWGQSLIKIKNDIRISLGAANYSREEIDSFFSEVVNPWSKEVKTKNKPKNGAGSWTSLRDQILKVVQEKLQGREPNPEVFKQNYSAPAPEPETPEIITPVDQAESEVSPVETEVVAEGEGESIPEDPLKRAPLVIDNYRSLEKELIAGDAYESFYYDFLDADRHIADLNKLLAETGPEDKAKLEKIAKKIEALVAIQGKMSAHLKAEAGDSSEATGEPEVPVPHLEINTQENPEQTPMAEIAFTIGQEVNIPRTSGAVSLAKIFHINNDKKLITVGWEENGNFLTKTLTESEIKSLNQHNPLATPDSSESAPTPVSSPEDAPVDPTPITPLQGEPSDVPAPNTETHERQNYTPERQEERKRLSVETRLARFGMNKAEEVYQKALYDFNVNKKFGDKVIGGIQKLRGIEVTTQHLKQLKAEADEQAEKYRTSLLTQINDRNRDRVIETALTADSAKLHQAFYDKLVTRVDAGEQTEIAKADTERSKIFRNEHPKLLANVERISKLIPKNKKVRLGLGLLAAAGFGATAGSLAAGSIAVGAAGGAVFGSARWLASTVAGMGVGAWVNKREGKKVTKVEAELEGLLEGQDEAKDLSIAEMRKSVRLAHAEVDSAKLRRTTKTLLSTFAAGLARGLIGAADMAFDAFNPKSPSIEETAAALNQNQKVMAGTPDYSGSKPPSFDGGVAVIPADKLTEVQELTQLTKNDFLADNPNLAKDQLEKMLTEKLSIKYGAEDWWKNSGINQNNIGDLVINESPFEKISILPHEVKSGENLSTILHKSLVTQFDEHKIKLPDGVNREDLGKLLYKKFPELGNPKATQWTLSPQEWKELGIKSGNPHLIHPGEKIDLAKLTAKLVDSDLSVGKAEVPTVGIHATNNIDVLSHPKTGPLPIEQVDPFEQQIKISQEAPWKPISSAELESARAQGILDNTIETKPVAPVYHVPESPKPGRIDGNFYNSLVYQKYLHENGINRNLLERITAKTLADFEGQTLTRTEEIFGKFDSPYHKLSKMTMGQLEKIEARVGDSPVKLQVELKRIAGSHANFKPLTINAWFKWINEVKAEGAVPYNNSTTLADLFKRDMAAKLIEMNRYNLTTRPK